jgi:hypothetical protein
MFKDNERRVKMYKDNDAESVSNRAYGADVVLTMATACTR